MTSIGYQWLCKELGLQVFPIARPAVVGGVSRVTVTQESIFIPSSVAPGDDSVISHILFAIKHEGVNLQVLSQAVKYVNEADLCRFVESSPSSRYVRLLGFLWESFNQCFLDDVSMVSGPTVGLFDEKKYITAPGPRNSRWKVRFNGLGTIDYCVVVERTSLITALLEESILDKAYSFIAELDKISVERALSWAYLHETESSYAIEKETPAYDKTEAFMALLKQAHHPRKMDEGYLVELQNVAVSNPFDQAGSYRHQQNWLRGPLRGVAGITYIPPPPSMVDELMSSVLAFANELPKVIDPIISACIASFGFVFIHPFMDGNGRLSRFLFHYALCQSGQLPDGMLLPVSIAMKRNEAEYLKALQSFSVPMRQYWNVSWLHDEEYLFAFKGEESLYRYWDATPCVEFGLKMTQESFEKDLREETVFLEKFDRVYRAVDEAFDVRGNELTTLVLTTLQNNGKVSIRRRKKFQGKMSEQVFEFIEKVCEEL
ncbi:Fic family protein [Thiomicrorhabdus sp. 6S2-11]|uniref:Fic family protein n=1 Tax=Thiomicrorhabdus marina TaxID=2818442 RepID=A0ABS3Q1U8_9GAMM|nr:Fic family protein [Thiomicrorhabdus marina]MBO1926306.1 Fic family protein [Thiomicrorhabdus marina]